MNTRVRSRFLRALRESRIPPTYPDYSKRVPPSKLQEALDYVYIWGHKLFVKTTSGQAYRIIDREFSNLIDINGNKVRIYDIADYFVCPPYQVY